MAYLKQNLPEDTPVVVRITERFAKTEGQYGPKFPYRIVWQGTTYDHDATMTEEKALQKFQPGQEAQVTKKKNSFGQFSLYWNEVQRGAPMDQSPVFTPQNPPPKPLPVKPETDWERIDMSKIVFGYMNTALELGKTPEECKAIAIRMEKLQRQAVDEIMLGIPSVPAAHSPAQLQAAEAAFGSDPSAEMIEHND